MRGDYGGDVHVKEREEYETRADYPSARAQSKEEKQMASACHCIIISTNGYISIYTSRQKRAMMFTTARREKKTKKRRKSHLYRLLCNRAVIGKSKPLLLNPCTWLIACSLNCNMDDDDDDDALVAPTTLLVAELPPPPPPVAVAVAAPLVVVVGGDVDPKAPPGGQSRRSEDRVRAWTPSEDISLNYYGEEMV